MSHTPHLPTAIVSFAALSLSLIPSFAAFPRTQTHTHTHPLSLRRNFVGLPPPMTTPAPTPPLPLSLRAGCREHIFAVDAVFSFPLFLQQAERTHFLAVFFFWLYADTGNIGGGGGRRAVTRCMPPSPPLPPPLKRTAFLSLSPPLADSPLSPLTLLPDPHAPHTPTLPIPVCVRVSSFLFSQQEKQRKHTHTRTDVRRRRGGGRQGGVE